MVVREPSAHPSFAKVQVVHRRERSHLGGGRGLEGTHRAGEVAVFLGNAAAGFDLDVVLGRGFEVVDTDEPRAGLLVDLADAAIQADGCLRVDEPIDFRYAEHESDGAFGDAENFRLGDRAGVRHSGSISCCAWIPEGN